MSAKVVIKPVCILRHAGRVDFGSDASTFTLKNDGDGSSPAEVVLDYQRCEGGVPVFVIDSATGSDFVHLEVVYSEGIEGIEHATGDGPFFLFSNAMDTYRSTTFKVRALDSPQTIKAVYAQRSQRYQKITLSSSASSISFTSIGFESVRPSYPLKSTFTCSKPLLNKIWQDGAKTVDMCTVAKDETSPAWEVAEEGTIVRGQHWAPCRHGTRWADKKIRFQVRIRDGGASWAVHMVANGLIFCLDVAERVLYACEGLSTESTVFPVAEKGRWPIGNLQLDTWLDVQTVTRGNTVTVLIQGRQLATVEDLDIRPILSGSANNTGSVAFGGPCQWVGVYRNLSVHDLSDRMLYKNTLQLAERERTLADFQVGTNALACTIDGAKRDRACFGGDLYVMGQSIAHSSMAFEAVAGSIELLTSHQTTEGYLGNLCPIQAPVHDCVEEPPTYAFYSLSYSLLLVVAIRDYWLHTGDENTRLKCYGALEKLMAFTNRHLSQGVVIAPPPLSMHWFPLGGPVFGASGALNNAYYEALQAMVTLSDNPTDKQSYQMQAHKLKSNILQHFYDSSTGIYHLDKNSSLSGICQDVKAHAMTLDLLPHHADDVEHLTDPSSKLPRAFRGLGHWDVANVVSPYATGYAVEALFSRDRGVEAVNLIEQIWGPMADTTSPNYSGGHWEAMKPDGTPHGHDTSLIHGWSTWPVSLMPRYLAGLRPIEPGWKSFNVAPVLSGLEEIKCTLETVVGTVGVQLRVDELNGHGSLEVLAPLGVRIRLQPPQGWVIQGPQMVEGIGAWQKFSLSEATISQDAVSKQTTILETTPLEASAQPREYQESSIPSKIRQLLSCLTALRT